METDKKSSSSIESVQDISRNMKNISDSVKDIGYNIKDIRHSVQEIFTRIFTNLFSQSNRKPIDSNRQLAQATTTDIYSSSEKYEGIINESPRILSPEILTYPKTLILAVYADQNIDASQEIKHLLKLNQLICEKFYEATQYLCIVEDSFFQSKENQIKNFIVPEGKERDDDIYLIKLHLKDDDERFNPRVNQIDRIRAFRELPNLVDYLEISLRLRLEAGRLFNLYHR